MTIIDTFYILFKGDASGAKKAADEASKSVKSFLTFVGAATAAYKVLQGISEAANYSLQLGDSSRALGVNAAELDAWGNAVRRNGGTVEGFQKSLDSLSQHFGTNAQIALRTLPQLADAFQRLGRFRSLQYGKILGLDQSTILLLQQGRREVESIIQRHRELSAVSERDIEVAQKYRTSNIELEMAFRGLNLELGRVLIPLLTKFYTVLVPIVDYVRNHKDLIIGAFIGIGAAATVMLAPFLISAAPFLAIAAAITTLIGLFALIYEDIQGFRKGHNSLIGEILKSWPTIGNVVSSVIDDWILRFKSLIDIFKIFQAVFDKTASFFQKDTKLTLDIERGRNFLDLATSNGLSAQTSGSIFNSQAFQRNSAINTGPITIHTQATDAEGISRELGRGIQEHLWQAENQFANGVAY